MRRALLILALAAPAAAQVPPPTLPPPPGADEPITPAPDEARDLRQMNPDKALEEAEPYIEEAREKIEAAIEQINEGEDPGPIPGAGPREREGPEVPERLHMAARLFFQSLISGIPDAAAELSAYPFNLDGERIADRGAMVRRLAESFRTKSLAHLPYYGMRVVPAEAMVEEHGAPPARLGEIDLEGAWVGVVNLGGHGYVAVFRETGGRWAAVAYTD